jgi:hypothetical protein
MPVAGGILTITAGAVNIILGIASFFLSEERGIINLSHIEQNEVIIIWFIVLFTFMVIAGIVAIIGGIFALRRKTWCMALSGSILSSLLFMWFLGVPSVVFI